MEIVGARQMGKMMVRRKHGDSEEGSGKEDKEQDGRRRKAMVKKMREKVMMK